MVDVIWARPTANDVRLVSTSHHVANIELDTESDGHGRRSRSGVGTDGMHGNGPHGTGDFK